MTTAAACTGGGRKGLPCLHHGFCKDCCGSGGGCRKGTNERTLAAATTAADSASGGGGGAVVMEERWKSGGGGEVTASVWSRVRALHPLLYISAGTHSKRLCFNPVRICTHSNLLECGHVRMLFK